LGKKRDNLIAQRNKIHAHNDKDINFDVESVYNGNPLFNKDIDDLIDFAQDYTVSCVEYLSGEQMAHHFGNIDDLEYTLQFVRKGIESKGVPT
ncbi:MAG: hypothetical protein II727_07100, partial [Oscillospiraceae bacterium]|nr:hypothetical protein [Oscillospiraceae bacterium]